MKQIEQEMQWCMVRVLMLLYPLFILKKERLNKEPPKNIKIIIQSVNE